MLTLPVSSSVYQTMVANIQHLHTNSDGTLCITPMQVQSKTHPNGSNSHNHNNTSSSCNIGGNGGGSGSTVGVMSNKYGRTLLSHRIQSNGSGTVGTADALMKSFDKILRSNNNNSHHHHNNNIMIPKLELADADHSNAIIDPDGNIIIRLGDSLPIKIECDNNEVKAT